jgi:hypothetical protein
MNSRFKAGVAGLGPADDGAARRLHRRRQQQTENPRPGHLLSATWEALPAVSDSDLLAGFGSWRSACNRLKADPVWGATCRGGQRAADRRGFAAFSSRT